MSKKHFVALAKSLRELPNDGTRKLAALRTAEVCKASNPRFDLDRFLAACGVDNE